MIGRTQLVVLACALMAGAAVAHPCINFNWFPTKSELGFGKTINCTSTTAPGGCASPQVWSQAAQDSTGLRRDEEVLFNVAVPNDNVLQRHTLYWIPSIPANEVDADVSQCVQTLIDAAVNGPAPTRRLQHAARRQVLAGAWTSRGDFVNRASVAVDVNLVDDKGASVPNGSQSFTLTDLYAPRSLTVPFGLKSGNYCWILKLRAEINPEGAYDPSQMTLSDNIGQGNVQVDYNIRESAKVCFYKRTEQSHADITYSMCKTGKLEINMTHVEPLAQKLLLNGTAVNGTYLLQPMLKVFGHKTRNLDGSPADSAFDQNAQQKKYIAKYFLLPSNITGADVFHHVFDEDLDEGYYAINAVVSMATKFPQLVALAGLNKINQSDVTGNGFQDTWEGLAVQITNGSEVGVQYSPTRLSQISASAKDNTIKTGSQITFKWTFNGVGTSVCLHDGVPVKPCVSPVTVAANQLVNSDTKHTFSVSFTDVCGRKKEASYSYTQAGVKAVTSVDPIIVTSPSSIGGSGADDKKAENAAQGQAVGVLRTLGLTSLAAAVLAALL